MGPPYSQLPGGFYSHRSGNPVSCLLMLLAEEISTAIFKILPPLTTFYGLNILSECVGCKVRLLGLGAQTVTVSPLRGLDLVPLSIP